MNEIKRLYITGYRSYELGIFKDNDPKIKIIKNILKNRLLSYLDLGLEWILLSGNLGVEYWTSEILEEIKTEYPQLKWSLLFPYSGFGENWNEQNQEKLNFMKTSCDYKNSTSKNTYINPSQLKAHTLFLLTHTEGSLLLYDEEYEGKTKYFLKDAQKFQEKNKYVIDTISMDDLQNYTIY